MIVFIVVVVVVIVVIVAAAVATSASIQCGLLQGKASRRSHGASDGLEGRRRALPSPEERERGRGKGRRGILRGATEGVRELVALKRGARRCSSSSSCCCCCKGNSHVGNESKSRTGGGSGDGGGGGSGEGAGPQKVSVLTHDRAVGGEVVVVSVFVEKLLKAAHRQLVFIIIAIVFIWSPLLNVRSGNSH